MAQAVGLQAVGMRPLVSATHTVPAMVYLADLLMPFGNAGFAMRAVQVLEFSPHAGSAFQALLGRDLLCQGTFHMSFDGHFTICM